jgi:hypothetical protein
MSNDPADYEPRAGYANPWVAVKYLLYYQHAALIALRTKPRQPLANKTVAAWWKLPYIEKVGPFAARSSQANKARKLVLAQSIDAATFGYVSFADCIVAGHDGWQVDPRLLPHPKPTHRIHPDDREEYSEALAKMLRLAKAQGIDAFAHKLRMPPHGVRNVLQCKQVLTNQQAETAAQLLNVSDVFLVMVRLTTNPWGHPQ